MALSKSCKEKVLKFLEDLENALKCKICEKVAVDPQSFSNCEHFFCKSCVDYGKNSCIVCGVPCYAKDIIPDKFIRNVTQCTSNLQALMIENPVAREIGDQNISDNSEKHIAEAKHGTSPKDVVEFEKNIEKSKAENSGDKKGISDRKSKELKESCPPPKTTKMPDPKNARCNRFSGKRSKVSEMYTTPTKKVKLDGPIPKNVTHSTKKSANKRNMKGEAPLHIACIKGNIEQVKSLVHNGANPNVKDNFGWTPLYEAVNHKHLNIVKFLLETAGAWVNTPGGDNMTPLHNAAFFNWIEGTKTLVEWGANPRLADIYGRKPLEFRPSEEITAIMEGALTSKNKLVNPILSEPYQQEDHLIFIGGDGLSKDDLKLLTKLSSLIPGSKVAHKFSSEVTHIVVKADNGICSWDLNVLKSILSGKVIVSLDWVGFSIKMKNVVHSYNLGVRGTKDYPDSNGIIRSRLSNKILLPNLFSGMHFSLSSLFRNLSYKNLTKEHLISLIMCGGGRFLNREPDPEAIPVTEKTVPFFANNSITDVLAKFDVGTSSNLDYKEAMLNKQLGVDWRDTLYDLDENHPLKNCSHVILYPMDKSSSQLEKSFMRYNMAHLKSLPIDWFIGCIESYSLLDPTPFI